MIQKLKMAILSLSTLFLFAAPLAVTGVASAAVDQNDINNGLCNGSNVDFTNPAGANCPTNSGQTANKLVKTVINLLSLVVGAIAVIMLIVGGFRYVTSGGKDESVKNAKNTILYALIGLVIVALAQLVVHYVLTQTNTATT